MPCSEFTSSLCIANGCLYLANECNYTGQLNLFITIQTITTKIALICHCTAELGKYAEWETVETCTPRVGLSSRNKKVLFYYYTDNMPLEAALCECKLFVSYPLSSGDDKTTLYSNWLSGPA